LEARPACLLSSMDDRRLADHHAWHHHRATALSDAQPGSRGTTIDFEALSRARHTLFQRPLPVKSAPWNIGMADPPQGRAPSS
jgi:hypothetical protein